MKKKMLLLGCILFSTQDFIYSVYFKNKSGRDIQIKMTYIAKHLSSAEKTISKSDNDELVEFPLQLLWNSIYPGKAFHDFPIFLWAEVKVDGKIVAAINLQDYYPKDLEFNRLFFFTIDNNFVVTPSQKGIIGEARPESVKKLLCSEFQKEAKKEVSESR